MLLTLATLFAFAPQGPGPSLAPVVINEFSYDDDGVDDLEFVELYNRTAAPVDISGWRLQGEEGDAAGAPNGAFVFPGLPGSGTTIILPGQYLLVSMPGVPNHNPLYVMPSNVMENGGGTAAPGSDGLTLRDGAGNVIDAVVWEYAGWTAPVPPWLEGSGLQGGYLLNVSNPGLNGATPQRWADGFDSDNNGADFVVMQWTPGAPNGSQNPLFPPIVENFDAPAGLTVDSIFASSFVSPTLYAPNAVTTSGVGVWSLPPSPQGGNVAALHDTTGGGNSHVSLTSVGIDFLVELFVYIAGGNAAIGASEGDAWAIGVGTTDAYGHPRDVAGNYYPGLLCNIGNGPGSTGIAWVGYNRQASTEIYLVDFGPGGPGATILAGPIVATPSVNNGWKRLRLRVSGNSVVGNYGGTFGADNGQRFTATVTPRLFGQVYLAYRECILVNANMRPLVIDRLEIYPTLDSNVTIAGVGSPTLVGTPTIGTAGGLPQIGNSGFQIVAGNLIPFGVSVIALDTQPLLPGVPVPGTQPALLLYAAPTVLVTVLNSATGTGTLTFPIPPINALLGGVLSAQYFDIDITLPFVLPFGSSPGCQFQLGNG